MKITILAVLAVLLPLTSAAQSSERYAGSTTPVELNRELPRTRTISYPSEELAVKGGGEPSRYYQPLTGWTTHTDTDGNTVFTTKYKVPFEWVDRRPFLHIAGAGSSYTALVNGKMAGYNQSGRTPAEFDLKELSEEGLNQIEIIVYRDPAAKVLNPAAATPTLGEVYITAQPRVRIRDFEVRPLLDGDPMALELTVLVKSHLLNPKTVRVHYSLTGPDGTPGPYGHRDADFEMKLEDTVSFFVPLPELRAWSHETPFLYTLNLRLQHEGRFTEYISYPVGLRTVEMRDGQMLVNGRRVSLVPAAYTPGEDMRALKESGKNLLLLSGPAADSLYTLADRLGLYVCGVADIDTHAAGPSRERGGNPSNDPEWAPAYVDRALEMYHSTKSHPSAVMFALADDSSNGYNLYESYLALKRVEPLRPIVYLDGGEWNDDPVVTADNLANVIPTVDYLRDTVWMDGRREVRGRIYRVTNRHEVAEMRDWAVEWTLGDSRAESSGTSTLTGTLRPGESREIVVGTGKTDNPRSADFLFLRPAEPFDAPAPEDGKRRIQLPRIPGLDQQQTVPQRRMIEVGGFAIETQHAPA